MGGRIAQAAALVAGVAAMLFEEDANASVARVTNRILANVLGAVAKGTKGAPNSLLQIKNLLFSTPNFNPRSECRVCVPACKNGGFCEGGICNCVPGFQGLTCETYNPFRLLEPLPGTGFFSGQNVTVRWDYVGVEARQLVTFTFTTIPSPSIFNPPAPVTVTMARDLPFAQRSFTWTVPPGLDFPIFITARSAAPFAAASNFTDFAISGACNIPAVDVCERPVIVDTTENRVSAFPRIRYTINGDAPGTVLRLRFPPGPSRTITLSTCGSITNFATGTNVHGRCHVFANTSKLASDGFGHASQCPPVQAPVRQNFVQVPLDTDPGPFRAAGNDSELYVVITATHILQPSRERLRGNFALTIRDPLCPSPPPPTPSPTPSPSVLATPTPSPHIGIPLIQALRPSAYRLGSGVLGY
eukprot:tig00000133_g7679.t1